MWSFGRIRSEQLPDAPGRPCGRPVLCAASYEVVVPSGRVCCGLTWITTGQLDHARAIALGTLAAPELAGEEPIVVLEPSCAATLRSDLVELLPDDPRARSVARRVTTLSELLDGIALPGSHAAMTVDLVQPHCHAQAVLGMDADARVMASAGIAVGRVLAGCCGLAGNFGAGQAMSKSRVRSPTSSSHRRSPRLIPRRSSSPTVSVAEPRSHSCRGAGRDTSLRCWPIASRTSTARPPSPRSTRTNSGRLGVAPLALDYLPAIHGEDNPGDPGGERAR